MRDYALCIKMSDAETAYHYQHLAQMWKQREGGPCNE